MSYYSDIYHQRLDRYGYDRQTRIQKQRERAFEDYLQKSVYALKFSYNNCCHPATLEPYKQDETETIGYFLTRVALNIAPGTILWLPNKDGVLKPWMIWWLENMKASGYNRYVVLRMTHQITWDVGQETHKAWCYFYGPGMNKMIDTQRSFKAGAYYGENENVYRITTPFNQYLKKDSYFVIHQGDISQGFRSTEFDTISSPGVMYISIDPVYVRDESDPPEQKPTDDPNDFYWINGGENGDT